jgi:hypothetical protein
VSESSKARATVTYRRGGDSVEMELSKIQSYIEDVISPTLNEFDKDIRELRTDRDSAKGMLKVIVALQALIIGLIIACFSWGLNHMSFRADFYEMPPSHTQVSPPIQSNVSTESHPTKGQ